MRKADMQKAFAQLQQMDPQQMAMMAQAFQGMMGNALETALAPQLEKAKDKLENTYSFSSQKNIQVLQVRRAIELEKKGLPQEAIQKALACIDKHQRAAVEKGLKLSEAALKSDMSSVQRINQEIADINRQMENEIKAIAEGGVREQKQGKRDDANAKISGKTKEATKTPQDKPSQDKRTKQKNKRKNRRLQDMFAAALARDEPESNASDYKQNSRNAIGSSSASTDTQAQSSDKIELSPNTKKIDELDKQIIGSQEINNSPNAGMRNLDGELLSASAIESKKSEEKTLDADVLQRMLPDMQFAAQQLPQQKPNQQAMQKGKSGSSLLAWVASAGIVGGGFLIGKLAWYTPSFALGIFDEILQGIDSVYEYIMFNPRLVGDFEASDLMTLITAYTLLYLAKYAIVDPTITTAGKVSTWIQGTHKAYKSMSTLFNGINHPQPASDDTDPTNNVVPQQ